ncbi:MAG: hypothetical protein U9R25_14345 [Chloroflexota bacterium]|nr:hypothetical protein [Chloroflexota bacterium]
MTGSFWPLVAASLAWLVPAGLALIAIAGAAPQRVWRSALGAIAAISLGVLAFFLAGFAIAFGGIGLIQPDVAGFDELVWEWSLMGSEWGPQWGTAGLAGWALAKAAATPDAYNLFFSQLPWVATATMIPLIALRGRTAVLSSLLGGILVGGLLYPLATNWVWGGGWLANLGYTANLGHGFVDFAGAGTVHLVGGAVALAGLLTMVDRRAGKPAEPTRGVNLPPVQLPVLASVGAFLVLAGSVAWSWANPLLNENTLWSSRGAVNVILVALAGALLPLAYTWFVANRSDALMAARGLAAGAVAGAAIGPFVAPWAALVLGAVVGLLVPLLTYLVREVLRVEDDTGILPVHLTGGLAGLIALGFLADGLTGRGWNDVGVASYLGVAGQGVTGLMVAEGMQSDWPGQMLAQLLGMTALFLVPFLAATLVFGPLAVLIKGLDQRPRSGQSPTVEPAMQATTISVADLQTADNPTEFQSDHDEIHSSVHQ